MNIQTKYKILFFVCLVLLAMNVATIGTLVYHARQSEKQAVQVQQEKSTTAQGETGTRYFREQLNLDMQQTEKFREINREYNRASNRLARQLEIHRIDMVEMLGSDQPDTLSLRKISHEIGVKHEELKNLTIHYYLDMKSVCNEEQKEKLRSIFRGMVQKEDSTSSGQGGGKGYRWRGGRK